MKTAEELGFNPGFDHLVWVKITGYMMSEEAQDQRDALLEWFLRSNFEEDDMESIYTDVENRDIRWKGQASHMVFGFKDPQKAIQFKLAWG